MTLGGVFIIAFMKGGFGRGFAIVGIPLLFVVMDLMALRYWKPNTWSKPDLKLLLPGMVVGIALGTVLLKVLDGRAVAIAMALITLAFAALWLRGGGRVVVRPRSASGSVGACTSAWISGSSTACATGS